MRKDNVKPYTLTDIKKQLRTMQSTTQLEENKKYARLYLTKRILKTLYDKKDGLRKHDLRNRIIVTNSSTLQKTLDSLVKGKILKVKEGPNQRRDYHHKGYLATTISGERYFITDNGNKAREYIEEKLS